MISLLISQAPAGPRPNAALRDFKRVRPYWPASSWPIRIHQVGPPSSRVGPITGAERKAIMQSSPLAHEYDEVVDRDSPGMLQEGRQPLLGGSAVGASKAKRPEGWPTGLHVKLGTEKPKRPCLHSWPRLARPACRHYAPRRHTAHRASPTGQCKRQMPSWRTETGSPTPV
jgi:hypothetical protein